MAENVNVGVLRGEESISDKETRDPEYLVLGKVVEHAVVVLGEASESDEEEEIMTTSTGLFASNSASLKLVPSSTSLRSSHSADDISTIKSAPSQQVKYKSLLHRKLRERNVALRRRIVLAACQQYQTTAKDVNTISQQLLKAQTQIQEVGPILRQLTNDLFHLEDKLEITMDCSKLIPAINIEVPITKSPFLCT